jgi:methylenetetrahydrofolate dehydrogenase (NADP+)/methenyltetrahydrofolate cyclohydrolase
MEILDGKLVSNSILKDTLDFIKKSDVRPPNISVILVGENPASLSYVNNKIKACDKAGIGHSLIRLNVDVTTKEILSKIDDLNNDDSVDGFIVQLPLPSHINSTLVINSISPEKDIDGFHPINFGKMSLGQKSMRPATAYGILKMLQFYKIDTIGKHVVVIGRSNIVGKPVAIMLGNDFNIGRSTVTSCDINTPRELLVEESRRADIVIVAVGKPKFLTSDMIKDGCVVIDVGINRVDGQITGDVDFYSVSKKCSYISPVPGGVGPMTICGLILNTIEAWKIKHNLN